MRIGIIDADLIYRKKHRFPNLACMKISSHHKNIGDDVCLITDYGFVTDFDKIYLSRVFTDTVVPEEVLQLPNIEIGGTGFFYDKAEPLPEEVEHTMPDYHLYDNWVEEKLVAGGKRKDYVYYTDYSIGFLTRGCFRQCEFCVNRNYTQCTKHSPIEEFYDESRPKLCFLDDNFFACPQWEQVIETVKAINRPFQFKQGLDERLLTDKKIHEIYKWRYDGDFIFAFDNIDDRQVIEEKLLRIYELYPQWKKHLKFYVFCGYDRDGKWDDDFYIKDIQSVFDRIKILSRYSAVPYIMRYEKCYESEYNSVYATIASWCNQPNIFKKFSYELYCKCKGMGVGYGVYKRDYNAYLENGGVKGKPWRNFELISDLIPQFANDNFHFIPAEIAEFGADVKTNKEASA